MIDDASKETLVVDIVDWLATTTPEAIAEYATAISQEQLSDVVQLGPEYLSSIRVQRNTVLEKSLGVNLIRFVPESVIVAFIDELTMYETASVVAKYQKYHPNIPFRYEGGSLASATLKLKNQWQNVFYLLTVQQYLEYCPYVDFLVEQPLPDDALASIQISGGDLLQKFDSLFLANNYEPITLTNDLQNQLRAYLSAFTFLPKMKVDELISVAFGREHLRALRVLKSVIDAARFWYEVPISERNATVAKNILWSTLRDGFMVEQMVSYEAVRQLHFSARKSEETGDGLKVRLGELFTIPSLSSGTSRQVLLPYHSTLSESQHRTFQELVRETISESTDIATLFCAVDPDTFLDQITSRTLTESRKEYIASLKDRVLPEFWPLAEQAMLLVAEVL